MSRRWWRWFAPSSLWSFILCLVLFSAMPLRWWSSRQFWVSILYFVHYSCKHVEHTLRDQQVISSAWTLLARTHRHTHTQATDYIHTISINSIWFPGETRSIVHRNTGIERMAPLKTNSKIDRICKADSVCVNVYLCVRLMFFVCVLICIFSHSSFRRIFVSLSSLSALSRLAPKNLTVSLSFFSYRCRVISIRLLSTKSQSQRRNICITWKSSTNITYTKYDAAALLESAVRMFCLPFAGIVYFIRIFQHYKHSPLKTNSSILSYARARALV